MSHIKWISSKVTTLLAQNCFLLLPLQLHIKNYTRETLRQNFTLQRLDFWKISTWLSQTAEALY